MDNMTIGMLQEEFKRINEDFKKIDIIIKSAYYDSMQILSDCSKKTQRKVRERINQIKKEQEELVREVPFEVYSIMAIYLSIEELLKTNREQKIFNKKDEDILLIISAFLELIFKSSINLEEEVSQLSDILFSAPYN